MVGSMAEHEQDLAALHVVRLRDGMADAINLMDNIHRGLFAEVQVVRWRRRIDRPMGSMGFDASEWNQGPPL